MKMGMGERTNIGGQRRRSEGSATHEAEAFPPTHEAGAFPPSQLVLFHYSIDCRLHVSDTHLPVHRLSPNSILEPTIPSPVSVTPAISCSELDRRICFRPFDATVSKCDRRGSQANLFEHQGITSE